MAIVWRFSEYPDFRSTFRHPTALANAAGAELEAEVPADWLHLVAKPMRTSRGSTALSENTGCHRGFTIQNSIIFHHPWGIVDGGYHPTWLVDDFVTVVPKLSLTQSTNIF
jgi:hypothetical protein